MKVSRCRGCKDYDPDSDEYCKSYCKGHNCPCSTCLIKMMCDNSCELYDEYDNLIRREYRSDLHSD